MYFFVRFNLLINYKAALKVLETENAQLWWAGKELQKNKKLCDYVGKNEKTKIIAKLQKVTFYMSFYLLVVLADNIVFEYTKLQRGLGAPAREPVFSEDEQKKMMSFAYKRQEELKV